MPDTWLSTLPTAGLLFARLGGALAVAPAFCFRTVPVYLRLGVAAAASSAFVLGLQRPVQAPAAWPAYLEAVVGEAAVGAILGGLVGLTAYAVGLGAGALALFVGVGSAPAGDVEEAPATGLALLGPALAATIFLAADGHHWLLGALDRSLQAVPLGMARPGEPLLAAALAVPGQALSLALWAAAPVVGAVFLADLTVAAVQRAAPFVPPGAVGPMVRWPVGLLAVALSLPLWVSAIARLPDALEATLQALLRAA